MTKIILGSPSQLFSVDAAHPNRMTGSLVEPILADRRLALRLFSDAGRVDSYGPNVPGSSNWMQDAETSDNLTICANMCDSTFRRMALARCGMRFVPTGVNIAISAVFHGPTWGKIDSVEELIHLATESGLSILGDTDEIGPQFVAEQTPIGKEMDVYPLLPLLTGRRPPRKTDVVLIHGILAPMFCETFGASGLIPQICAHAQCGFAPLGLFVNDLQVAQRLARCYRDAKPSIERDPLIRDYRARGLLEVVPIDSWPEGCVELLKH